MPSPSPNSSEQTVEFLSFRMFSPNVGWALDNYRRVLQTSDGALMWRNVTPTQIKPNIIDVAFFLDQRHAWLATMPRMPATVPDTLPLTFWFTADGGQTWTPGVTFTSTGDHENSSLTFVDAQHGWYKVNTEVGAGGCAYVLYRTEDGGSHWEQISMTSRAHPEQSTPGSFQGCATSGLSFLDAARGWAVGSSIGLEPGVSRTRDGGRTWQFQALPLPTGDTKPILCEGCLLYPPTFVTPTHGVMLAQWVSPTYPLVVYVTDDGGQTWQPKGIATAYPLISQPADFIDKQTGWFAGRDLSGSDVSVLYVTHDGGESWTTIAPNTQIGGTLSFVTDRMGWSVYGSALLKTEDSGNTWIHLTPQILP